MINLREKVTKKSQNLFRRYLTYLHRRLALWMDFNLHMVGRQTMAAQFRGGWDGEDE